MNNNPVRQHYLPKFYLNGFADTNGKVNVFDEKEGTFKNLSTKDTAIIRNYYTIEDENGDKNFELEKLLCVVEAKTAPIIQKLNNQEIISLTEKEDLALFVALLQSRTTGSENKFNETMQPMLDWVLSQYTNNEKFLDKMINDLEKEKGEKCPFREEVKSLIKTELKVECTKEGRLNILFNNAFEFAGYYNQMEWTFIYAPKGSSFITTDNPFVIYEPKMDVSHYGAGVLVPTVEKLIPLSSKVALWMGDKSTQIHYKQADKKWARLTNERIFVRRERIAIANSIELLQFLLKRTGNKKYKVGIKIN